MILALKKSHPAEELREELRHRGIDAVEVQLARQTLFVVERPRTRPEDNRALAALGGVERVIDVSEPYQLVHRAFRPEGTRVNLGGGIAIGRGRFAVMADMAGDAAAGALSSLARTLAHGRAAALIVHLPDGDGLPTQNQRRAVRETLEKIRDTTGLRIGIDVSGEGDLIEIAPMADLLRVAGGQMQDYRFLRRVGATGKPVVLVRALSATLEEWLLAAEYLAATGNDQVILCERGIRSFAPETGRVTLDLASVARLSEMTHLPVIVDPLQSCGSLSLGARLARAAVAAGADGIIFPLSSDPAAEGPVLRAEGLAGMLASLGPALVAEGKRMKGIAGARTQA